MLDSKVLLDLPPAPRLKTGTPALDALLSPDFPNDKGEAETTTGGILPGIVHVLAGPTWLLAELLMHLAITSQLPVEHGGIGCERVIYGLFDNATNPCDGEKSLCKIHGKWQRIQTACGIHAGLHPKDTGAKACVEMYRFC
ncbi:MAG TPA: hypothetical protein VKM55_21025 [Candidatus Lokiarchaeia archaeon]|nr:hypothetical protein [Candidatus Lokiarchaeia archaeon]